MPPERLRPAPATRRSSQRRRRRPPGPETLKVKAVRGLVPRSRRNATLTFVPDSVQASLTGLQIVHLHQQHLGVPVYQGRRAVRFSPAGREVARAGKAIAIPAATPTTPLIKASAALSAAADHIVSKVVKGLLVPPGPPELVYQYAGPPFPSVFRKAPFREPLTAHLTLYPTARSRARLAWAVHLILPRPWPQYEVLVSADRAAPQVLLCRPTTACAAEGRVFEFDPDSGVAALHPFPRPRAHYPFGTAKPTGFPAPWVDLDATSGNNVVCLPGNSDTAFTGTPSPSGTLFAPAAPDGADQWTLNAFYVCNLMHDFFYLLGFDEEAGNFQRDNPSGLGKDDDRLIIRAFDSLLIEGGATLASAKDGQSPEMDLGLVPGPAGALPRHTALDAGVVIHEFVHAVTSRRIGGRQFHAPLAGRDQPEAMGEGYSDFFALTILNHYRRAAGLAESWVFGRYSANNASRGLRRDSYVGFTGTYRSLQDGSRRQRHDAGQVWCAALLDVRSAWIALFGGDAAATARADELAWRVVLASLDFVELGPLAPSFLHGRDALLEAFEEMDSGGQLSGDVSAQRAAIRTAFAARGMGPQAQSPSTRYQGIVAHF